MKKIVFCIPDMIVGGVETVLGQTLISLSKHSNIELTVCFHMPLAEPFWIEWFNNHNNIITHVCFPAGPIFERVKTHIPVVENIRRIFFSLYKKYRRVIFKYKFRNHDVLVDYKNGSFYKEFSYCKKKKTVTWLHSSYNYFAESKLYSRFCKYDKIVCITDACLEEIANNYPDIKDKLIRIYNPSDYENIAKKASAGCSLPYTFFVCVSRLDKDKDVGTVIKAFDVFWRKEKQPECKLVIIGDGINANFFQSLAASQLSKNDIIFLGKIPEPFGYMHDSLAQILSSYSEGLPTVMIEASACGTLNIASDCPNGPKEIALNGKAGLLFKPGNVEQLAEIMSDVWNNKIDKEEIISNARKELKRFDANVIASQILKLID